MYMRMRTLCCAGRRGRPNSIVRPARRQMNADQIFRFPNPTLGLLMYVYMYAPYAVDVIGIIIERVNGARTLTFELASSVAS